MSKSLSRKDPALDVESSIPDAFISAMIGKDWPLLFTLRRQYQLDHITSHWKRLKQHKFEKLTQR